MSSLRFKAIALACLLCALAVDARAGAISPCSNPIVFDSKAQVHIFPYEADGRLTDKGRALATLLQRHVLFAALKYPSIGVEELVEYGGTCNARAVMERIRSRLKPTQTAIFLTGRVFEQDGRIHLKNFVTVAAAKGATTLAWPLAPGAQATITTEMPLEVPGFAPRTIPVSFLERLESSQALARRIHVAPDANSTFKDLPNEPADRYTYQIFDARNDWMRVRVMPYGIEGWLPAHTLASSDELKGEFPELYFVDALVGYFSLGWSAASDRRTLEATLGSIDRYLSVTMDRSEADPRALAYVLKGNARLRAAGADWPTPLLQTAQAEYRRAAAESPSWTAARSHLLASTAMLCVRGACENEAKSLEAEYLDAIGRDPLNRDLVVGLNAYYEAATLKRLATDLTPDVLASRRQKARAVESDMQR
jgi:hypothetical protein